MAKLIYISEQNKLCVKKHTLPGTISGNDFATFLHQLPGAKIIEKNSSLGNTASYSYNDLPKDTEVQNKNIPFEELKYNYKNNIYQDREIISKYYSRILNCNTKPIGKVSEVHAVKGEKGSIYYQAMQHCGSIWFCQICMYKLMKARAEELQKQLKIYRDKGKIALFITFTLQHDYYDRLDSLYQLLMSAFDYANKNRKWSKYREYFKYLTTSEVLYGLHGWHTHLHSVFITDNKHKKDIDIFINLYKDKLREHGLMINEHTVVVEEWSDKIDNMQDYLFKSKLEEELTSGGLKKSGAGKTFFELVREHEKYDKQIEEYVLVMKGKHQYHRSRDFFNDIKVKTDNEILKDDKVAEVIFRIPIKIYYDIKDKGIALRLLNEYEFRGLSGAIKLLELYDCDTSFIETG